MTTFTDQPRFTGCPCGTTKAYIETGAPSLGVEDWLTPEDVVALLRGALSLGTLRNYRSARVGPAYIRIGRAVFYPRAEVSAWLAEQVRESEARWNDR
ncbi:helix-turn-helix transcriptional regulator [Nocardioides zhouii]|uniref:DNA-binding protein n=1 Tax=Nocardioides zhouii TaxID=1168729 RepID=A0A4Q2SXB6_9ACTN|nr:helix-turn-helix domain-containing protein [Nocardioides zhouii]RYC10552.1 DNA-binding protein [Nocardioides zhouii]